MKRFGVVLFASLLAALPAGEAMASHARTPVTRPSTARTIATDIGQGSVVGVPCSSISTCLAVYGLLAASTWTVVWSGTPCAVRRSPGRFVTLP